MDEKALQEIFNELFRSLEAAETQSAAVVQFLKAKGMASDEDLAPHFEQASKASSVRWVATKARINRLISAAAKPEEKSPGVAPSKQAEQSEEKEKTQQPAKESPPDKKSEPVTDEDKDTTESTKTNRKKTNNKEDRSKTSRKDAHEPPNSPFPAQEAKQSKSQGDSKNAEKTQREPDQEISAGKPADKEH
ncbi:MAG TPA: hypothetical protein VI386_09730 [Candidatus Sulfotelmatobacter sp.]